MIFYILKSSLLLLILITVYKFFLENEKMHKFNRIYLLCSLLFSFIIPFNLFSLKAKMLTAPISFQLNEIILQKTNENIITNNLVFNYLIITIYSLFSTLLIIRFLWNLYSFYKKIRKNEHVIINGNKVILLQESVVPHSFLNYIFLNKHDCKNNAISAELIIHEKAHILQKHTLDILFIEILQILFWFNPLILFYKSAIKLNHEFLADEIVNTRFNSIINYQNMLLNIASNKQNIALASSINYSITKKRLMMMTKKQSPIRILSKTALVGFIYSMLLFSFSQKSTAQEQPNIISNEAQRISEITQPEFPDGILAFYKFVGSNFRTPKEIKGNGKIYVTFMVEKDGSLTEFEILHDMGFGTGSEVIRVLKLSPKWIPGKQNNQPVRVKYNLPISIQAN